MDPLAVIREYYDPASRAFDILVTHSRLVAEKAVTVARRLTHLEPDIGFVEEAAMLHDIGIFMTHAPGIGCTGDRPYLHHGVLGRELLEKKGLFRHALVCERHVGTGITAADVAERQLPLPRRDMLPVSLEEKIVCYADKFFSKSGKGTDREKPVPLIVKKLSGHGQDKADTFLEWHRMFAPAEQGAAVGT